MRVTRQFFVDIAAILGGVATVCVAGLAFWGFFFTDIPEALVRQLRTDIADLNEEAVSLRSENNGLRGKISGTRDKISRLRDERIAAETLADQLRDDVLSLKEEQRNLGAQIFNSLQTLAIYRAKTLDFVSGNVVDAIEKELRVYTASASKAASYNALLQYVEVRYLDLKRDQEEYGNSPNLLVFGQAFDKNIMKLPRPWLEAVFNFRSGHGLHVIDPDEDKQMTETLISNFRQSIALEQSEPHTACIIINRIIDDDLLSQLPVADRTNIRQRLHGYMARNAEVCNLPIEVRVSRNAEPGIVTEHGKRTTGNIDKARPLIKGLRSIILSYGDAPTTDQ